MTGALGKRSPAESRLIDLLEKRDGVYCRPKSTVTVLYLRPKRGEDM